MFNTSQSVADHNLSVNCIDHMVSKWDEFGAKLQLLIELLIESGDHQIEGTKH